MFQESHYFLSTHFYDCFYCYTCSITGRITVPLTASYSVTKYGVEAFSDALRREMQPWQIKVTILEPGRFATTICTPDFSEKELRKGWNQLSEELKNDYGEEFLEKGTRVLCQFHNGFLPPT